MNRFHLIGVIAFISSMVLVACGEKVIEVASVAISQPSAEIEIGETLSLKAAVSPSNAVFDGMIWTSTKPKVASVSDSGLVSAISEGSTTITVMAGGKTASCSITVVKGFVAVSSINLDKASLEMVEGDTETLIASVLPDDATDKTVTWTSSEKGVATVKDGVVSAISPGTATITAKAGDVTAICNIVVQKKIISVESVELDRTKLSLYEGTTDQLVATVTPDNADDSSLIWSSSNPDVVQVTTEGKLFALAPGEADITVTTVDGGFSATCKVTVYEVILELKPPTLDILIGDEADIQVNLKNQPEGVSINIRWYSVDESVVTVDDKGHVKALAVGDALVSAATENGKTAFCEVHVRDRIASVTVTAPGGAKEVSIGSTLQLTAVVTPSDLPGLTIEWKSSNTSVATVGSEGLVTAKSKGTVTITVTVQNGPETITATYEITVKAKVEGITIQGGSTQTVQVKKTLQLKASITPSNASQEVTWSSSKPAVATVDANGLVTGVTAGTTVITATSKENPSIKATCTVRVESVNIPVSSVELDRSSLSLTKGGEYTLNATVKPDDATDKTVSWRSSNTSVATVDSNGKIKAIAGGSATITATAGGVSAKCSVTVSVPVTSVSLNKTSLNLMVGDTETLSATIYPSDATNKNVTWKSSNTSVATVQSGKVSAVGVGTAQITVTTNNGSKKATCTVTVTPKGDPGPKGYKVFIKHGGEFKYDDIPGWGTYQGKAFTSPNTKYNYSGDNHELNVTTSSTEVKNMLNELGMSINQLYENYGMDSPEIFVKKNASGYYVEPGDIADEGSNTNLYRVSLYDINDIYGYGLIISKSSPSNWGELLLELGLILDPEVSIGGPHFVYVVYPAFDNTKNVDVVVKFVYNVTR